MTISLGHRLPDASSDLPGSDHGSGKSVPRTEVQGSLLIWPCSRWGLPSRTGHPARWWALTPPFHPYLDGSIPTVAVCFLWHFPYPKLGRWALPTTAPCGVRTFLRISTACRHTAVHSAIIRLTAVPTSIIPSIRVISIMFDRDSPCDVPRTALRVAWKAQQNRPPTFPIFTI